MFSRDCRNGVLRPVWNASPYGTSFTSQHPTKSVRLCTAEVFSSSVKVQSCLSQPKARHLRRWRHPGDTAQGRGRWVVCCTRFTPTFVVAGRLPKYLKVRRIFGTRFYRPALGTHLAPSDVTEDSQICSTRPKSANIGSGFAFPGSRKNQSDKSAINRFHRDEQGMYREAA